MIPKRSDDDAVKTGNQQDTPTAAAYTTLRAAADHPDHGKKSGEEQMSLFWRVFGGTILSIAALVGVTVFNNLISSISELRADLTKANEARATLANDLRADLARAHEARGELARKDELQSRMSSVWERFQTLQTQAAAHATTITGLKTENDALKDKLAKTTADLETAKKEICTAVEALKKDQTAATDALKKDVSALESVKDRLTLLCADVKTAQAEYQRLRTDVDKNVAYDLERKTTRDKQYSRFDEAIKELQKNSQDAREKLARLEALAGATGITPTAGTEPAKPVTTKKVPVEAVPTSAPKRPAPTTPPGTAKPAPESPDGDGTPKDDE